MVLLTCAGIRTIVVHAMRRVLSDHCSIKGTNRIEMRVANVWLVSAVIERSSRSHLVVKSSSGEITHAMLSMQYKYVVRKYLFRRWCVYVCACPYPYVCFACENRLILVLVSELS